MTASTALADRLAARAEPMRMIRIPGGTFLLRSGAHDAAKAPRHRARMDACRTDEIAPGNAQCAGFVKASGDLTAARRPLGDAICPVTDPSSVRPPARLSACHARRLDTGMDHIGIRGIRRDPVEEARNA